MRTLIPLRYLVILTHISVFLFTAFFVGFAVYSATKDYYIRKDITTTPVQLSQKSNAEEKAEYAVYESRKVITARPNNMNVERVTGYALNIETGEDNIVYSFLDDPQESKLQKTVPTPTLLKNGMIFINGVSDFGYVVLDLAGNNLTRDYKVLRNRDLPVSNILFKNEKEIFATFGGINPKESDGRHKIYLRKEGETSQVIDSSSFPSGEFWLKPIGWSSRQDEFYVERQSDSVTYAQIWRVNGQTGEVTAFQNIKGAITAGVKVCPQQDFAIYISTALDPSADGYGKRIGPSKLMVANLAIDASQLIYSSDSLLKDFTVSCKSKRIIVKEKDIFHLFDVTGKELPHSQFVGTPLFFSGDGKTVIVKNADNIYLLNIQTGKQTPINGNASEESDNENQKKVRYTVLGLSRF